MTALDPVQVAHACFQAYADSNRSALEVLIADTFSFTSPLDNGLDRATYFDRCWPNHATITAFEFVRSVRDGDTVMVTYEGCSTSGRRFRNTEVLTVHKGQITVVEVYFGWNVPHDAVPGAST